MRDYSKETRGAVSFSISTILFSNGNFFATKCLIARQSVNAACEIPESILASFEVHCTFMLVLHLAISVSVMMSTLRVSREQKSKDECSSSPQDWQGPQGSPRRAFGRCFYWWWDPIVLMIIEELGDELPDNSPRFLLISFEMNHKDGRVSYPLVGMSSSWTTHFQASITIHLHHPQVKRWCTRVPVPASFRKHKWLERSLISWKPRGWPPLG